MHFDEILNSENNLFTILQKLPSGYTNVKGTFRNCSSTQIFRASLQNDFSKELAGIEIVL
jgi:hypothetical protein